MKRPKKVIVVAKKYLPRFTYEFLLMGIPYKIMNVDCSGKLKLDSISIEILELLNKIKEAEGHIKDEKEFIKREEKDIERERSCIRYWKNELKKLRKGKENEK